MTSASRQSRKVYFLDVSDNWGKSCEGALRIVLGKKIKKRGK
jgi:hypothetical protein